MKRRVDAHDLLLAELLMGELIGRDMEIVKSTRKELIGVKGRIVDETLNTFLVETKKKEKTIPKALCVFRFKVGRDHRDVDGRRLVFRPEDRIKKYWRTFDGEMRRQKLSSAR